MKHKKRTVFLADDHVVLRDGIKALINAESDLCVVGEAGDGITALNDCGEIKPDVIVLDITMPGMSGVEVTKQLHEVCPQSRILVLTVHESTAYLRQMLEAGASGYVVKRSPAKELIHGIRSVAEGGTYIDPKVAEKLAIGLRMGKKNAQLSLDVALSERELDVLRLIAQGHSSKEIAGALNIGSKSVDTYKLRAMQKLGLESRADVVRYAMGQGWLE
jgi:DNA-binding NarL/FixJ family response regulator